MHDETMKCWMCRFWELPTVTDEIIQGGNKVKVTREIGDLGYCPICKQYISGNEWRCNFFERKEVK